LFRAGAQGLALDLASHSWNARTARRIDLQDHGAIQSLARGARWRGVRGGSGPLSLERRPTPSSARLHTPNHSQPGVVQRPSVAGELRPGSPRGWGRAEMQAQKSHL